MNTKEKLKKLYETMDLAEKYYHAVGLINFDLETISPENAMRFLYIMPFGSTA